MCKFGFTGFVGFVVSCLEYNAVFQQLVRFRSLDEGVGLLCIWVRQKFGVHCTVIL